MNCGFRKSHRMLADALRPLPVFRFFIGPQRQSGRTRPGRSSNDEDAARPGNSIRMVSACQRPPLARKRTILIFTLHRTAAPSRKFRPTPGCCIGIPYKSGSFHTNCAPHLIFLAQRRNKTASNLRNAVFLLLR